MVGQNIQTMILCVFSGGKRLEKGKIIQEILQILKIPFRGIQIKAILRNSSLILGEKNGGRILGCFFIFLRFQTILGDFNRSLGKVVRMIFIAQPLL